MTRLTFLGVASNKDVSVLHTMAIVSGCITTVARPSNSLEVIAELQEGATDRRHGYRLTSFSKSGIPVDANI